MTLTVQCGTGNDVTWTDVQKNNLRRVFSDIDDRLNQRAGSSFQNVFGGLEIRHVFELTDASGRQIAGQVRDGNLFRIGRAGRQSTRDSGYGLDVSSNQRIQHTIVHELGHVMDYRTRRAGDDGFRATGDRFNLRPIPEGNQGLYSENSDDDMTEIVADHFLNWVYRGYIDPIDPDDFDKNSGFLQRQIAAFWLGGHRLQVDANTFRNPSIGIRGWAQIASEA